MAVNVDSTSRLVMISTCILVVGTINLVLLFHSRHDRRNIEDNFADVGRDHTQIKSSRSETKESVNYLKELRHAIDKTYQAFEKKRIVHTGLRKAKVSYENRNSPKTTRSLPMPRPGCDKKPFLLIQVHSSPSNFLKREAIRLSWGSPQNSINKATSEPQLPRLWRTVFLVGQTGNSWLDNRLYEEAKSHGDLLHGDFLDSYRNLSRKMAFGIEWAAKHYHGVQFVMKTDDDSYIDILELIKWLERFIIREDGPLYGGAVLGGNPSRDLSSLYYVSEEEYPEPTYPPYASGAGYVFSGYLLPKLSAALKEVKIFPNEDACFGVLMRHIKVAPTDIERFAPFTMQLAAYRSSGGHSLCQFKGPLLIHRVSGLFQIQTHFNVQIMKHAHTICDHIANGIGDVNKAYFMGL